jgi:hypothetical protein
MSKVIVLNAFAKDFFPVSAASKVTTWLPGQGFMFNSTGEYIEIANCDSTMFIAGDDEDELATPPTGSILTVYYGSGTKLLIDHSEEVAASNAARVYESEVASAAPNANLYIGLTGKWQTTSTGAVKGKLFQVPSAYNNYTMGVILRF